MLDYMEPSARERQVVTRGRWAKTELIALVELLQKSGDGIAASYRGGRAADPYGSRCRRADRAPIATRAAAIGSTHGSSLVWNWKSRVGSWGRIRPGSLGETPPALATCSLRAPRLF